MNAKIFIAIAAVSFSLYACGQSRQEQLSTIHNSKTEVTMDYSKLSNTTVRSAMEAWQNGDSKTFLSFFTANATMTDDGNPRDFQAFVKEACGTEKYLSIDRVENEGKDIYGNFHAGSWGTFKVFFKFHLDAAGKFDRLDIGQAN